MLRICNCKISCIKIFALVNTLLILILDIYTKFLSVSYLKYHQAVDIFSIVIYKLKLGLNLFLTYNKGTAFSIIKTASGNTKLFLLLVSSLISIILLVWLYKEQSSNKTEILSISLILGGALGNIYDRLNYGYVIDFIDVYANQYHWPVFNVADMAISVGVFLLGIKLLFYK